MQSFILTDIGSIYTCGDNDSKTKTTSITGRNVKKLQDSIQDPVLSGDEQSGKNMIANKLMVRKILCTEESLYVSLCNQYLPLCNLKSLEKTSLNNLRKITQKVLDPLCNSKNKSLEPVSNVENLAPSDSIDNAIYEAKANLVTSAHKLIDWLTTSVSTSWNLAAVHHINQLLLIREPNKFCSTLENYSKHVCDCLAVDCLTLESRDKKNFSTSGVFKSVDELLRGLYYEKTPDDNSHSGTRNYNIALQKLLLYPVNLVNEYISCLNNMSKTEKNESICNPTKNNALEKCILSLKAAKRAIENEQKMMNETIEFWESCNGKFLDLRAPTRRVILDSRHTPISLSNAGNFSKHWLILMNDILLHAGYSSHNIHYLRTVWIEAGQNIWVEPNSRNSVSKNSSEVLESPKLSIIGATEREEMSDLNDTKSTFSSSINPSNDRFEISLIMPEDELTLVAGSSEQRAVWLNGLQKYINEVLYMEKRKKIKGLDYKTNSHSEHRGTIAATPISRSTTYVFRKIPELKNASYDGSWMYGKLHGEGTLTWLDGSRSYVGHFRQNIKHGLGEMVVTEEKNKNLKTIFNGQWKCDKFEGIGTIQYSNGDVYKGSFKDGRPHGHGVLKQGRFMGSGASVYVGEWVNGSRNGYGVLDDIISGEKYMGMWYNDMKCGAGSVVTVDGVYYEGTFAHNKMTGRGLMIFDDDTIYDGNLSDAGKYITCLNCESQFKNKENLCLLNHRFNLFLLLLGVFSGHGILTYKNGDHMEGSFYGNYTDGMKFNGTIYKTVRGMPNRDKSQLQTHHTLRQNEVDSASTINSIGRYSVTPNKKWCAIYTHYHDLLGLPHPVAINNDCQNIEFAAKKSRRHENRRQGINTPVNILVNTPILWEQIAIQINKNKNAPVSTKGGTRNNQQHQTITRTHSSIIELSSDPGLDLLDGLEIIPDYHHTELTFNYYKDLTSYLKKAFSNKYHPLTNLLNTICDCYTDTYGGVRIHPRLLRHAVEELGSMVERMYYIVCAMFPALPKPGKQLWLKIETDEANIQNDEWEMVTSSSIMYPHILQRIHPSIFMLYALHYKKDDDEYWLRILKWNRHPDMALLSFLGVDQKFWNLDITLNYQSSVESDGDKSPTSPVPSFNRNFPLVRDNHFVQAIETLQQLKTTFTPFEKLTVILETFREVNKTVQEVVGTEHVWSMDDLFPVFQYIVVRARILQLGAEIHMIEDLMESHHTSGEYGIMFTTLQASYYQILKESLSII